MSDEQRLYRVFTVAGRRFPIYYEYYETMGKSYPDFPDLVSRPEYTDAGQPFAHYVQEGCKDGACRDGSGGVPENCGLCRFFRWETPDVPIGVCENRTRKQTGTAPEAAGGDAAADRPDAEELCAAILKGNEEEAN